MVRVAGSMASALAVTRPLKLSPGTRFDYTQTNYVVMGKIIEKITGKSYADFVRDRQFDDIATRSE